MEVLQRAIKEKAVSGIWLLYGDEAYLKNLYRDRIIESLGLSKDDLNYSYFEGADVKVAEATAAFNLFPIMAEKRLVVLENTNLFERDADIFREQLLRLPETTVVLLLEAEVNKTRKVYKTVQKQGHVVELSGGQRTDRRQSMLTYMLGEEGLVMERSAMHYILENSPQDLYGLRHNVEKVILYVGDAKEITLADAEAAIFPLVENRIFDMIAAVGARRPKEVVRRYRELLYYREAPMRILTLLIREFNMLLQTRELNGDLQSIREHVHRSTYVAKKYIEGAKMYTVQGLMDALRRCADLEYRIKSGQIGDKIGLELLLLSLTLPSAETEGGRNDVPSAERREVYERKR